MPVEFLVASVVGTAAIVSACFVLAPLWRRRRRIVLRRQLQRFQWHREQLEAKFFDLASRADQLHEWENVEFGSPVSFVRDRTTGRISALVELTVVVRPSTEHPTAVEPHLLHATATFQIVAGRWITKGRLLENVSPREAVHLFPDRYEMLMQPSSP